MKVFLLALTATAAITRRDAITVQNDITQKIGPQTEALLNDVNGFPASGLGGQLLLIMISMFSPPRLTTPPMMLRALEAFPKQMALPYSRIFKTMSPPFWRPWRR